MTVLRFEAVQRGASAPVERTQLRSRGRMRARVAAAGGFVKRWLPRIRPGRTGFATGVLCGVLLVFAARYFINKTTVADWVISPLLTTDTDGKADAIVVMGAGVVGDCLTNQYSVRRVLLSVRLWKQGRAPIVLFTGGASRDSCPVAVAMGNLAHELGVPQSSIRLDPSARSTRENGERSAPILHELGARRVLIVTDRLHMRRAAAVFGSLGFEVERASVPIYEGHADNVSMLGFGLREFAALGYYRARGWVGTAPTVGQSSTDSSTSGGVPNGVGARPGAHPDMAQTITNPGGPLVVLGASYAGGWKLDRLGNREIVNRGVTGQQSFELLERFDRDVAASRPRAVIVWGFINDIFRAPSGDLDAAVKRAQDSYVKIIAASRTQGIEPILATEVTVRAKDSWGETFASWAGAIMGKESYEDRVNRQVTATNQWLKDTASREGLLLLDFQGALADEKGRRKREFTQDDGSHITPAGYERLTAYATPILAKHLGDAGRGK